jgi:hypothetical protein
VGLVRHHSREPIAAQPRRGSPCPDNPAVLPPSGYKPADGNLTDRGTAAGGPPGRPTTGGKVVPYSWRKSPQSGPMLVAGDSSCPLCRAVDSVSLDLQGITAAKLARVAHL